MSETAPQGEIILYQTDDGRTQLECRFADESIWLTQRLMAELFQVTPQNVTLHLKAIYKEGELDESATCKEYLQVRSEGGREVARRLVHYSLPAILAVGYRVRSPRGTAFRQWATARHDSLNEMDIIDAYTSPEGTTMDNRLFPRPVPKGRWRDRKV